jgi:uncharacterized protein YjiS (DUF1127 family)
MDTIMTGPGFNQLSQLDRITQSAQPSDRVWRAARAAVMAAYELVCLAFDWQWEWRQRAYERRLLNTMNGRERADIGLSPRDDSDGSVASFWRD